jgi:hypothetical protein
VVGQAAGEAGIEQIGADRRPESGIRRHGAEVGVAQRDHRHHAAAVGGHHALGDDLRRVVGREHRPYPRVGPDAGQRRRHGGLGAGILPHQAVASPEHDDERRLRRIRELPRDELLRDVRFDALRGARVEGSAPPEHERGHGEREAAGAQDGPVPPEGQVCEPAVHGALPRRVTVEGVRATERAHVAERRAQRQAHCSGAGVLHAVLPAASYLHDMDRESHPWSRGEDATPSSVARSFRRQRRGTRFRRGSPTTTCRTCSATRRSAETLDTRPLACRERKGALRRSPTCGRVCNQRCNHQLGRRARRTTRVVVRLIPRAARRIRSSP